MSHPDNVPFDVLFSCDRTMLHALNAALVSLLASLDATVSIRITIATPPNDLTVATSAVHCALGSSYGVISRSSIFRFVAFGEDSMRGFPARHRLTNVSDEHLKQKRNLSVTANFARFYLPELLPAGARFVLYSDVDVIFNCSILRMLRPLPWLFASKPRAVIAAVGRIPTKNTRMDMFVNLDSMAAQRLVGASTTPSRTGSFNAGFFVAHVERWRAQNVTGSLLNLMWEQVAAIAARQVPPWQPTKVTSQSPLLLLFYKHYIELPSAWNSASVADRNLPIGRQRSYCLWHFSGSGQRKPWCDSRPCRMKAKSNWDDALPKCMWEQHSRPACVPSALRPSLGLRTCRVLDDRASVPSGRRLATTASDGDTARISPTRLAVCITGQLGRLELDSKLQHLLAPLHAAGVNVSVFLALEIGAVHFSNPKPSSQGPGCGFEPTPESILHRLEPYLAGSWIGPRADSAANISLFPRYRLGEANRQERLLNHVAQFEHSRRCAALVLKHERHVGLQFDALLKIRDNSLAIPGLLNASLLANVRGVHVKQCAGRSGNGRNPTVGLNDKVMLASSVYWRAALVAPHELMRLALRAGKPVLWFDSEEVYGLSLRKQQLPIIKDDHGALRGLVDGRCRHQVKHRADPTASRPGDMDKRWCALPHCKDCWPGNAKFLTWPVCGSSAEWCWWLNPRGRAARSF